MLMMMTMMENFNYRVTIIVTPVRPDQKKNG